MIMLPVQETPSRAESRNASTPLPPGSWPAISPQPRWFHQSSEQVVQSHQHPTHSACKNDVYFLLLCVFMCGRRQWLFASIVPTLTYCWQASAPPKGPAVLPTAAALTCKPLQPRRAPPRPPFLSTVSPPGFRCTAMLPLPAGASQVGKAVDGTNGATTEAESDGTTAHEGSRSFAGSRAAGSLVRPADCLAARIPSACHASRALRTAFWMFLHLLVSDI